MEPTEIREGLEQQPASLEELERVFGKPVDDQGFLARAYVGFARDRGERVDQDYPATAAAIDQELDAIRKRARSEQSSGDGDQDGENQPPPPLPLASPTALQDEEVPARKWIVPEWIPAGHTTALYGSGGTGKSLLAMQLATACATGKPFLGLETRTCRVLYVACEDSRDELHRRQAAINQQYGVDFTDLVNLRWAPRIGEDNILVGFERGEAYRTDFWTQVRDAAVTFGAELLIVDTASDVFAGNENDRGQVRQFIQYGLNSIAQEINGAVLLLAHPSRSGEQTGKGDSGSTSWNAAVRSRLYFETLAASEEDPEPDPDIRLLTKKKANYAASGDEIRVRFDRGMFQVEGGDVEHWIDRQQRENRAESVFLALLEKIEREGRTVNHKPQSPTYAPKIMARHADNPGLPKRDLQAAMERLFSDSEIQVGWYRAQDRKEYQRIERVPSA